MTILSKCLRVISNCQCKLVKLFLLEIAASVLAEGRKVRCGRQDVMERVRREAKRKSRKNENSRCTKSPREMHNTGPLTKRISVVHVTSIRIQ